MVHLEMSTSEVMVLYKYIFHDDDDDYYHYYLLKRKT